MRTNKIAATLLAFLLLAAACGDDDGSASPFADDNPFDAGDNQSGDLDLEELLEDVTGGDVDLDLGELLEGVTDGDVDLGDLLENAQNLAESFGDSGSGTVRINGDTINFSSEICIAFGEGNFSIDGAGTSSDGTPVWVSINRSEDTRDELLQYFDEATLTLIYGDADPVIDASVQIEYGRSEMFGSGDDALPSYDASSNFGGEELTMNLNGNSISGQGSAVDYNYVSGDFEATYDFTFEAGCS